MGQFEELLCKKLKKYDDVIIYGFEDIGMTMLDYIIDIETSIKIANYSGRVKYFATSAKERKSKRTEKKGIRIKSIYDLTDYAKSALVIIATQEQHHSDIRKILNELGFDNQLYILHENYCEIRKAIEEHKLMVDTNIQNYHINHYNKLNRLREKIKNGEKAKVFFMTHDAAVFGAMSVYRAMEKCDVFEPYIYIVSRRDVGYAEFMEDVKKDVDFFENYGCRVVCGYDAEGNPKDLHQFRPDILFYDIPKLYGCAAKSYNRMEQLNWEYLTCYIPYGMLMVDSFYYHYHTKCIRETWRFFLDTKSDFKRVLSDGEFNGFNTVYGGYPKYDDYFNDEIRIPSKIDNGKPIVIYAPHHSLFASNNFATFDLYKDDMLSFVKKHKEINFVIKPHPLLYFQIRTRAQSKMIDFDENDYLNYLAEWEACENGLCMTQGDYIPLFRKSACMITDCGSFIGEYFPSLNPCIYLFNPRKKRQEDVYTPLATEILDTYYITRTKEELYNNLENIIINGNDSKYENRKKLYESEFDNIGHSGETICNYLLNEISK